MNIRISRITCNVNIQIVHVSIAITKALIEDQEVPLPTNRSILAVVKVSSHGINQFIVTKNTHLWPLLVVASCTFTQDEVLDSYQGISIFHQHSSQAWSSLWTAILSKKTNKKNIPKSYSWYISNPLSTLGGKNNIPSHISCSLFPWGKNVCFRVNLHLAVSSKDSVVRRVQLHSLKPNLNRPWRKLKTSYQHGITLFQGAGLVSGTGIFLFEAFWLKRHQKKSTTQWRVLFPQWDVQCSAPVLVNVRECHEIVQSFGRVAHGKFASTCPQGRWLKNKIGQDIWGEFQM